MRPFSVDSFMRRAEPAQKYAQAKLKQRELKGPLEFIQSVYGIEADPWQTEYIKKALTNPMIAIVACRQTGKTTVTSGFAAWLMLRHSNLFVLTVSRSLRQASHLLSKIRDAITAFSPELIVYSNQLGLGMANGSKVLCVPCQGSDAARGFSPELLMMDEAAFVPDDVFTALTPSLAATQGALHMISTPNGPVGMFHSAVEEMDEFYSIRVRADHIDRFDKEFLATQRRLLGDLRFRQEYMAEFLLMEGAFFNSETTRMIFKGEELDEDKLSRVDYTDLVSMEVEDLERGLDTTIRSDWRHSWMNN